MPKSNKIATKAFVATRDLQALIDTLNNTTIGTLNTDIGNIQLALNVNTVAITLINTKINSIASIFGVTFNPDGTLLTETYSTHAHTYSDATIDATGIVTNTSRNTLGVNP